MSITVLRGEEQLGPFDESEVEEMLRSGELSPKDLAVRYPDTEVLPLEALLKKPAMPDSLGEFREAGKLLDRQAEIHERLRSIVSAYDNEPIKVTKWSDKVANYVSDSRVRKVGSFAYGDPKVVDEARRWASRKDAVVIVVRTDDTYDIYGVTEEGAAKKTGGGCAVALLLGVVVILGLGWMSYSGYKRAEAFRDNRGGQVVWTMRAVNTIKLNVRSSPGASSPVVAQFEKGARLATSGEPVNVGGDLWIKVSTDDGKIQGWANKKYLSP